MLYTAPTIRTAALGCRIPPSLLAPNPYHNTTVTPRGAQDASNPVPRRVAVAKRHISFQRPNLTPPSIRSASTITTPSPNDPEQDQTPPEHLNWNTFFKLRKKRRRYQLASSIGSSATAFVTGAQLLTTTDMDKLSAQIPLDPFISFGLITFACGGLGWLAGPFVGTAAFNLNNNKYRKQIDEREREFYARIKKFRVDPSTSSVANPVPDYYGEKIGSVTEYRHWLKDQRAFNRKRHTSF
ncbi:hypothetical protein HYFRA_00006794 [Hymenoscyphus fraxineus]|uniref:Presequence translocated-associated motor subunit PAM17 n=1 Tax=Hymenoscyphus fraxineus TaxID=746836 RepID=A0A9N9PKT6_9HELO|nr:hypothetical protein HYFRA_00006794 [Hymenoscyphus fraxineus]